MSCLIVECILKFDLEVRRSFGSLTILGPRASLVELLLLHVMMPAVMIALEGIWYFEGTGLSRWICTPWLRMSIYVLANLRRCTRCSNYTETNCRANVCTRTRLHGACNLSCNFVCQIIRPPSMLKSEIYCQYSSHVRLQTMLSFVQSVT